MEFNQGRWLVLLPWQDHVPLPLSPWHAGTSLLRDWFGQPEELRRSGHGRWNSASGAWGGGDGGRKTLRLHAWTRQTRGCWELGPE